MNSAWVFSIIQDRLGYLWFGTNLGVVRHDGLHYRVFRRANTLPNPLSNDYIWSIAQDAAGDLWMGTSNGLNRFNTASETFTVFRHDPKVLESLAGNQIVGLSFWSSRPDSLWLATTDNGLGLFNLKTGKCKNFRTAPARPGALGSNSVRLVFEDSRKKIWVATASGFHRFLPESETFEAFHHDPRDSNTIGDDNVFEIFESKSRPGILWVGTGANCLNRFDSDHRSWQRFMLPGPHVTNSLANQVYFVSDYPQDPDTLLVGTLQGLYQFNTRSASWQRIILQDQFREKGNPSDETINGVFHDRSGVCWVSILGRGLLKFILQPAFFRFHLNSSSGHDPILRNRIFCIAEAENGCLWLGTWGAGLFHYSPDTAAYEHITLAPSIPDRAKFDLFSILCRTRRNQLWAATSGGLVRFDPQTGEQDVYAANAGDASSLGFTRVASIHEDAQGDVWIGSDFCLLRWDSWSRTFKRYQHDPGDPGSLSSSHINPILEDREGNVWIGTENGLNLYDRDRDKFTRYFLDPPDPSKETQNYIMILHQDVHGRLWVGTSNGLNLMERSGPEVRFRHYSDPSSTLRNFILGITEDDEENLWISSNGGISRFDTRRRTFSPYDSRDGIPAIEFIYGAYRRSQTGELFFGGIQGMLSFKPWLAHYNRYVPPLVFTDIQIHHRPVATTFIPPLKNADSTTREIDLPYRQNSLTVSFAALSYIRPDKNQYAYRLDGRDGAWRELGFDHTVSLDNLKPGRYRLRIKGSNNEGIWNENGISLVLHIHAPFWQTWWFRALAGLAALAFFIQLNRTRSRRLAARIRTEAALDHFCGQFGISPREREIIQLLLKGKSNKEIEDSLFISMGTVKNHVYRIFQKLEVKNRSQLIALFKNLQIK